MKRLVLFAAALFTLGTLWAQPKMVSVRVFSEPCGRFYVDGVMYTRISVFLWQENSTHVLSVAPSYVVSDGTMCITTSPPTGGSDSCDDAWRNACFPDYPPCSNAPLPPCARAGSWVDSNGNTVPGGGTVLITATSAVSYYRTDSQFQFRVKILPSLSGAPMSCATDNPGTFGRLLVNGTCYDADTELWLPPETAMTLRVDQPLGWVFVGWQPLPGTTVSGLVGNFVLQGPMAIAPRFEPGIAVTFDTSPPKMKLLVDGAVLAAPAVVYWRRNSTHTISSVAPQRDDLGQLWVWESWSQGGPETQTVTMSEYFAPVALTANYSVAGRAIFGTDPIRMKLVIDGRDDWPQYSFAWRVGSTHSVVAPLQQADAQGRQVVFNSWSVPGGAELQFTVTSTEPTAVVAKYDVLGRLTILSTPGDINVQVDGVACKTPCVIDRRPGTEVMVSAPERVSLTDWMRLDFSSWSDGGPRERVWTATTDATTVMVNYQSSNLVQTTSDPAGGATFTLVPASSDGFYPANTDVTVTVAAQPGYKFKWWEGDASGTSKTVQVNTNLPAFLKAVLDRVPFVAPTGVRNAAGDGTAPVAVSPGSLISVYGGGLSAGFEKGPDSPLAQTLANVTVQVADRILPLLFVSPSQINAQLPSDLAEGKYKVLVRGDTQPDATALFTVRRNAPGLFTLVVQGKQYALAKHADGTLVTKDAPATLGETVTLLGTGFGPYLEYPIDGFAVPASMVLHLVDPVEILAGEKILTPSETVAATGYVGITAIRFKITDDLPAATDVELKVRVNYYWESNKVLLPVQ